MRDHVHEFDRVTFKCLVRGCSAKRDEPGQAYAFGPEAKPVAVSQETMFGNVKPDTDESTPRPRPEDRHQGKLF